MIASLLLTISLMSATKSVATRTLQINTARAYVPLLAPARYKGAHGGRGSAKSHFFAETLLDRCMAIPGTRAVCVREIQRTLQQSVKRLLEDKIHSFGLEREFPIATTEIGTPGGGVIIFIGMQDHTADSIKSLEGFDIAWVEEAQTVSERSLTLLRPTIREANSELWFSWNPRNKTDPVDKLLRGAGKPPEAVVVGTTYRDNPWFPEVLRVEMEWDRSRDPEKYAHVWLGEYERRSEARVFKNWRVEEFETPAGVTLYYGGDWGFSIDPTTLVRLFFTPAVPPSPRGTIYIDREVYKIGCEIDHTPALFDTLDDGEARNWTIVADSARPETISYLQRHGYPRIEPAIKGANSVKEGVIFLQSYDIVIHPRCTHTIDEFTMYSFVVDKLTGQVTNVLEDKKNHIIDPVRYATEKIREAAEMGLTW